VRPGQSLVFDWSEEGWAAPTTVEIGLTSDGEGTLVWVIERGLAAAVSDAAAASLADAHRAGWRAHLTGLANYLMRP
jgi:uncharacterized protein YndB with AHSA1/START domain